EGSDYCKLFEQYEPKEIGRQRYIESIIEGQSPSFGYVVLANLMASNYINTIITTNFDDLIYSACTSYTSIRPIVFAYGILASEMRITAQRPKILKLHGDYLYSTLKNTDSETAWQDPNMSRQLTQVLSEYGLIVTGYSGGDKSVMDTLSQISEKNDLYWCIFRGSEPGDAVKELLEAKGGFLIEIDGFDEMMNEVRHIVGFDVGKMLGSIQERQDAMIEKLKTFVPLYSVDILSEIVKALQEQAQQVSKEQERIRKIQGLDHFTKALQAEDAGDFAKAEELYRMAIELDPKDASAYYNLSLLLSDNPNRNDEAENAIRKAIELDPKDAYAYINLGNILYSDVARLDEAEAAYRKAIELNPKDADAYINLGTVLYRDVGRLDEAEAAYRKAIELDPKNIKAYSNLGFLLYQKTNRYDEAEEVARKALDLEPRDAYSNGTLVTVLRLKGRNTEARSLAEKWVQLDPQNFFPAMALASVHKELENQAESAQYAAQARQLIEPDDWYNLACLESISGNTDLALEKLKEAAKKPGFNHEWAKLDPDLQWIRDDPRFSELLSQG
ncbi:MAG TPA: tetratricopeptide repeat protein, partial [Blastocatellia bacterium]|nr:tetratricopeptide repeat protein [Blastocatellia bacterium]